MTIDRNDPKKLGRTLATPPTRTTNVPIFGRAHALCMHLHALASWAAPGSSMLGTNGRGWPFGALDTCRVVDGPDGGGGMANHGRAANQWRCSGQSYETVGKQFIPLLIRWMDVDLCNASWYNSGRRREGEICFRSRGRPFSLRNVAV